MNKTGRWEPVPEDEKEAVLHTQQLEKWTDALYGLYRHFNKDRVKALEEVSLGSRDLAREDFDRRLGVALERPGDESLHGLPFLAAVCGVHKSTISRHRNGHGLTLDGRPISQNEALRVKRIEATWTLFNICRDNGGDFGKLGPVIGLLPGQSDRATDYTFGLGFWIGNQTEEVQDRVHRDLGLDPVKERNKIQNIIKAFEKEAA